MIKNKVKGSGISFVRIVLTIMIMAVGVRLPTLSGFSIDNVGFKLTFIFITLLILVLLVLNNVNFRRWKLNV